MRLRSLLACYKILQIVGGKKGPATLNCALGANRNCFTGLATMAERSRAVFLKWNSYPTAVAPELQSSWHSIDDGAEVHGPRLSFGH